MAMLAEKKRKTKWCLNPMGNDWAKDENKFGQRMLEKMGWEPGTGLGKSGQGRTDIIKLNVKSDTKGLGCDKENNEESWTKQIESFDNLLAQLNGGSKTVIEETVNLPSLEEKSKASRARVHYHKFTRGKDVSKYSSKDLKCILPLSSKDESTESQAVGDENNMYEYFKNKQKAFNNTDKNINAEEEQDKISDVNFEEHCENDTTEEYSIKKKAKKKKKRKDIEDIESPDSLPRKKKSKSRYCDQDNGDDRDFCHTEDIEQNSDINGCKDQENEVSESKSVNKTKKKKKKHKYINNTDSVDDIS